MRLLTRKIHRAFPELDRFDDERCRRFVAVALRFDAVTATNRALIGLAFVGLAFPGMMGVLWTNSVLLPNTYSHDSGSHVGVTILWVLLCIPLLSIPPLAAFLLRDLLLRRRLASIIRARGRCGGCGYSLVGVPVTTDTSVTCPECGLTCEIDPALGELVKGPAGSAHFQPLAAADRPILVLDPVFWRRTGRRAFLLIGYALLLACITFGVHELRIRRQASRAQALRIPATTLLTLAERQLPDGTPLGREHAVQIIVRANKAVEQANSRARVSSMYGTDFAPLIAAAPPSVDTFEGYLWTLRDRLRSLSLLRMYRKDGVFALLRQVAESRSDMPWIDPLGFASDYAFNGTVTGYHTYELSQINLARMAVARRTGDRAEYLEAVEAALAIRRVLQFSPSLDDHRFARRQEAAVFSAVRSLLTDPPSEPTLTELRAILARQRAAVPISYIIECDRLSRADWVAGFFATPANVRWGKYSKAVRDLSYYRSIPDDPLGGLEDNITAVNSFYSSLATAASEEPVDRIAPTPAASFGLAMIRFLDHSADTVLDIRDSGELDRRAIDTLLALELFRARGGRYPAALAELVPSYLPALPIDPWSGRPLCYRVTDPATERKHRPYLLYSTGRDARDNLGDDLSDSARSPHFNSPSLTDEGHDYILNNPDR